MAFDWLGFLDSYNVRYVTKGANVARNHVSVKCPFCGNEDPSEHMTISLAGNGWRCYRNHAHRGVAPARLVANLIGCTWGEAQTIVGGSIFLPEDFIGAVKGKLLARPEEARRSLRVPREFRPLDPNKPSARPFVNYLMGKSRGFTLDQISYMHQRHGLMYAVEGPYRGRVIFPVWFMGQLHTWTARHINPEVELRYKTLSVNETDYDDEPALGAISDYLLWYDDIVDGGNALCIGEGPFDALKVRTLGRRSRIYATCCFTAQPSAQQIEMLHEVVDGYPRDRRFLLLDRGTLATSLRIGQELSALSFKPVLLPKWLKDPGELQSTDDLLEILGLL